MTELATQADTLQELKQHFPFNKIRPVQEQALAEIAASHSAEQPFTIIEAPTGAGKSAMGMTTALWSQNREGGAHYLTSQNSLSSQLMMDFEDRGLVELRGKANYTCNFKSRTGKVQKTDCHNGSLMNGGKTCEVCPYRQAKAQYIENPIGVTNYTYFLTERMFGGAIPTRDFLICDEAHNIEREILGFTETKITSKHAEDLSLGRLPFFKPGEDEQVRKWLSTTVIPNVVAALAAAKWKISSAKDSGMSVPVEMQQKASWLEGLQRSLALYVGADEPRDWMAWSDAQDGKLSIKPLTAADFAQQYLFDGSPNILMMSATILDFQTFRRNLGIGAGQARNFSVPSEFPVENRRIVHWPVGSMASKSLDTTLPRLAQRTLALLTKFGTQKGLIHTHSYKINEYLRKAIENSEHAHRLITHTSVSGSREKAILEHYGRRDEPTVLMSPSMTEGLDLKDDLSRFQIISKVPYPFLDPYTRTRMERDPKWYQLQTALSLVQATGRSVRSKEDHAITVVLDSDFARFLSKNDDILPEWWKASIEFKG